MHIGCWETRSTNKIYAFDFLSLRKHKTHPSLLLRAVLGKRTSFPPPPRQLPCVSRRKKTHYALLGKHFQREREMRGLWRWGTRPISQDGEPFGTPMNQRSHRCLPRKAFTPAYRIPKRGGVPTFRVSDIGNNSEHILFVNQCTK